MVRHAKYTLSPVKPRFSHRPSVKLFASEIGLLSILIQMAASDVVTLVGGQAVDPAGRVGQHGWSCGDIAGVAGRQQEDAGPAEDVGEGVDLGRLAAARRADGLRTRPALPPWAERCALT